MLIKDFLLKEPIIGKYDWASIVLGAALIGAFLAIEVYFLIPIISGIVGVALVRVFTFVFIKMTAYVLEDFPKTMKIVTRILICVSLGLQAFIILCAVGLMFAYIFD